MAQLFELSAELTLDPADFLRTIRQAEDAARRLQTTIGSSMSAASAAMGRLQGSAASAMGGVTASLQRAIDKARELSGIRMAPAAFTSATAAPRLATGMNYVPYNEFPALLHEGEAVLTKLEAAAWRQGAPVQAAVDPSAIASAVADALSGAAVTLDGQTVGEWIAPTVDKAIARAARARRYAP